MNRLRDQRGSADPAVARAARLLSSRAPLADDVARQQRVRARLRRRRRVPFAASLVRVALLIAVICSVAAASAMIGHVARSIRARMQAASAAKAETRTSPHRRRNASAAPPLAAAPGDPPAADAPPAAPAAAVPAPPAAPAAAVPAPAAVAAPPPAPLRAAPPRATPAASAPSETDEQRLLTSAVRALRHEHDPARAATLFARYLDRYPDGIATEDALALGLEATLGRDRARATSFATRYLSRYPSGRWSTLARRALEP